MDSTQTLLFDKMIILRIYHIRYATARHLSLQNSIYLPGKTNIQLEAWDRETVTDGDSNSYEVVIDTTNGCSADEPLSVTL